jgi:hypothetical protein
MTCVAPTYSTAAEPIAVTSPVAARSFICAPLADKAAASVAS